mmetsp:Transcript_48526/g.75574  ORF Transcript_48526/g.75574 Transcript_48526/m.75574 type:complete len:224 (+) Transcript_48526:68-739(+)
MLAQLGMCVCALIGVFASASFDVCSSLSGSNCVNSREHGGIDALVLLQRGVTKVRTRSNEKFALASNIDATEIASTNQSEISEIARSSLVSKSTEFLMDLQKTIDMELRPTTVPVKNKVILIILEILGLGICGIDRCYMGQFFLGVIKGVTLGGCLIWGAMDYVTIIVDCLGFFHTIDFLGYDAKFGAGQTTPAFVIALIGLILKCCGCCTVRKKYSKDPDYF